MSWRAAAVLLSCAAAAHAAADCELLPQAPIGSSLEDLGRMAQLTGAAPVRPLLFRRWSSPSGDWLCAGPAPHPSELPLERPDAIEILPLSLRDYLNSGYPDDRNDGAVWEGRGIASGLSGGVRARWKLLSAGFAPLAAWQQNRDFPYPLNAYAPERAYSPYANPFNYGQIDLPMRFGPSSYWTLDPGQSYVRADLFNVAAGFSTENLWWGPGTHNSILMTNSGPGFPHFFLGTSRPQDIFIGWLQAQIVWGRLSQSDYFRDDPAASRRLFTALTLGYEPRWIPGLFIGAARVFLDRIPPGGLPASDYFVRLFQPFQGNINTDDNQLVSVFARWVFPQSGLEIYGEYARDDYSRNFEDEVQEPEHGSAHMLGLQKLFAVRDLWVRLVAEWAHTLAEPVNNPVRPVVIFFTHFDELQGYTQRGQMIGAGIGPQADNEFAAVDVIHPRGRIGVWLERVLRNDRYFYDQVHVRLGHDAELAAGLRGVVSWRGLDVDWSAGYGYRYNAFFGADQGSWKLQLSATWWPGRAAPPSLSPR